MGQLKGLFNDLYAASETAWGAKVKAKTGLSFADGFASAVLAKYGIDLKNPTTLIGFDAVKRQRFFFDWYDGLMTFAGVDHPDHWMLTANWSPAVTSTLSGGSKTVIGVVDFTLGADKDLLDNLLFVGGYNNVAGGHGGAVASLLVAAHDGQGVMGIAPGAQVALSNPFDKTGTASWAEVTKSVQQAVNARVLAADNNSIRASVVNLSLGEPGVTFSKHWLNVYKTAGISDKLSSTIFVHGAGNDGVSQSGIINWDNINSYFVVVGSATPSGAISQFSNRPGNACFNNRNNSPSCAMPLKNRFMVAPGEWILTSDGAGGVTRYSGTSFAAPMVTGTIALLHTRWGWLRDNPSATLNILFKTARDLGEPGVDNVYGQGLLNIEAALSPLDFSKLNVFVQQQNGSMAASPLVDRWNTKTQSFNTKNVWGLSGGYFVAYEDVTNLSGVKSTYRDFLIPLSQKVTGTYKSYGGGNWQLQSYLADQFSSWSTGKLAMVDLPNSSGLTMKASVSPLPFGYQLREGQLPYQTEMAIVSPSSLTLNFGSGGGARALTGRRDLTQAAFSQTTGGVNPVLGFASGGAFASVDAPLSGGVRMGFGVTERTFDPIAPNPGTPEERPMYAGLDPYRAIASHVSLSAPVRDGVTLSAGYTFLKEAEGVLGVRSLEPTMLSQGAETDAASLGAAWKLSDSVRVSGSATLSRTRPQDTAGSLLAVSRDGILSSAFEIGLDAESVLKPDDKMRLALVQPMHVESGALAMNSYEVVDRMTGRRDTVERTFGIDGQARELALEASYATPVLEGRGQVAAFVRTETAGREGFRREADHMLGASFKFGF